MGKSKYLIEEEENHHSDDIKEIISKPPSWMLQRGISFVLLMSVVLISFTYFIRYPEIVEAEMKFNTVNAPKVVVGRVDGRIVALLAHDGAWVQQHTVLAYLESTADHRQVTDLLQKLKQFRAEEGHIYNLENIIPPNQLMLGELQGVYESFYLAYLDYRSSNKEGIYLKRKHILNDESANLQLQYERAAQSFDFQRKQLELAEEEYDRYRLLAEKKVISPAELQQKEAILLAKRQSIPQMEGTLLSYRNSMLSKSKELSDLDNQIIDEQKKFVQSLNSFISEADTWAKKYVLTSPAEGKLIYGSFLQQQQLIKTGQELFYINPNSDTYYGEMMLPQSSSAKVKPKQDVLIKVRSFPYREYGFIKGKVDYISDLPVQDSLFFARVVINRTDRDSVIVLKPGIYADAEVITEDQTIFQRIWKNLTKDLRL